MQNNMLTGQLSIFREIFSWVVLLPTIFLTGSWFRSNVPAESTVLRGIVYCSLGMAVLSFSVLFLNTVHFLNPSGIWMFLIICLFFGTPRLKDWVDWMKGVYDELRPKKSGLNKLLALVFFVSCAGAFLGAMTPETGGDALCYHLNLPKVFLARGSLSLNPNDFNSYFPMFFNRLYLIGLATGGVAAAKFFNFFCGFLLFVAVKLVISRETKNETIGYFFALIIWLTPTFYNMLSTNYVDIALAFYAFLALVSLVFAFEHPTQGRFFLSGLLAGCAASVKSLSVVAAIPLLAFWVGAIVTQKEKMSKWGSKFASWVAGIVVVVFWWLIRNWAATGNPVFPYLANWFGEEAIPEMALSRFNGTGRSFLDFISLFWNTELNSFFLGAFSNRLGIFYFFLLSLVILGAFFVPRARSFVLFGVFFLCLWFFYFARSERYLLPALPALSVAAALGWTGGSGRLHPLVRRLIAGSGFVLLGLYFAVGLSHYRHAYRMHLGQWTSEEYLAKMERTAPLARWVNEHLPPNAYILMEGETRQFYIDRPIIRNFFLEFRTHYGRQKWDAAALVDFFHSYGITHVIIGRPVSQKELPDREKLLLDLLDRSSAKLIQTVHSQNIYDEQFVYQIYDLV